MQQNTRHILLRREKRNVETGMKEAEQEAGSNECGVRSVGGANGTKSKNGKKKPTLAGLEPAISGSVDRCLIQFGHRADVAFATFLGDSGILGL